LFCVMRITDHSLSMHATLGLDVTDIPQYLERIYAAELSCTRLPIKEATLLTKTQDEVMLMMPDCHVWIPRKTGIIEYLGGKAWGLGRLEKEMESFDLHLNTQLLAELEGVLRYADLQLLLLDKDTPSERIYGLAESHWMPRNHNPYRQAIIKALAQTRKIDVAAAFGGVLPGGEVFECFPFNMGANDRVQKFVMVFYSLHHCTHPYRIFLQSRMADSGNKLETQCYDFWPEIGSDFNPCEVAARITLRTLNFDMQLEQQVKMAISRPLDKNLTLQFIADLGIAPKLKTMLNDLLRRAIMSEGNNEYALVHALTWLSTHYLLKTRDRLLADKLCNKGTQLLAQGLHAFAQSAKPAD